MPAKAKSPKIKVEEIQEPEPPQEKPVSVKEKNTSLPKVSSFSQLDSNLDKDQAPLPDDVPEVRSTEEPKETPSSVPATTQESAPDMSSEDVKEWLKDIRPDTSKDVEKGGNGFNGKLFFGLLIFFVLLGALAGGLFYYKQKVNLPTTDTKPTPQPTTIPTNALTPTPEEKPDLSSLSVNILNGSGTPGEAGAVKDILVKAGFSSGKLKTANAATYDFKTTLVQVKSSTSKSAVESLTAALSKTYEVELDKDNLPTSSSFDIVVTVGDRK